MAYGHNPILLGAYIYGMWKNEVISKSKSVPCSDAPQNTLLLCAPSPIEFLDQAWKQVFFFNNLDELQQISLVQQGKEISDLPVVTEALISAGWQPVFLESEEAAFDVIEEIRKNGIEKAGDLMAKFMKEPLDSQSWVTIYFLQKSLLEAKITTGKESTYQQVLDKAPENICQAALTYSDNNIKISFTAPLLARKNALRYGQFIKR